MTLINLTPPISREHDGIVVVRDDLFPGGTKARFIPRMFEGADELVYASPCEGGAQFAMATVAKQLGKKATIFVAKRTQPHPRALEAKALGASVRQVEPGYLAVVRARAQGYCEATGATMAPFGMDAPWAPLAIAEAAGSLGLDPDEVWCASGSGTLMRGLALAWPRARRHAVRVGRELSSAEVAGATIHDAPMAFGRADPVAPPFPSDPHYDAKAWNMAKARRGAGLVLFWNVTGPATPP